MLSMFYICIFFLFRNKSKWEDISDVEDGKNWRWSESPELEIEHRSRNIEKRRHHSSERDPRQKSTRDKRYEQSDRNKTTDNDETPIKRHRPSSRKHFEEKIKDDDILNGRELSRKRSKKYQRKREGDNNYEVSPKHSRKRYSKSSDHSYRSKLHKLSNKYSKKEKEDIEKGRYKLRNHNDLYEDSSKRKCRNTSERSNTEETVDATSLSRIKSKWDKENSEQIDSESTRSSDSDFSGIIEDKSIEASETPCEFYKKMTDDEWATTDSENESKVKK